MRINFKREGGYANIPLEYDADTDEMTSDIAEKLLELVDASGIWDLSPEAAMPRSKPIPDAFSFRLTLSEGERRKSLSLCETTAPASLRPLLELLQELASLERRKGR
jgi:hypothetical protein